MVAIRGDCHNGAQRDDCDTLGGGGEGKLVLYIVLSKRGESQQARKQRCNTQKLGVGGKRCLLYYVGM